MSEKDKAEINLIIKDLEKGGLRDSLRDQTASAGESGETGPQARPKKTESRYTLEHDAVLSNGSETYNCRILDISKNGCLITAEEDTSAKKTISRRSNYTINIRCMSLEIQLESRLQRKSEAHGTNEYAMEFVNISKEKRHSLNMLIHTLKKMGAKDRLESSIPLTEEEIDKTVSKTPYKIVLFFRKLIMKDVG